jgi:signal transduction histidine kinase
MVIEAVIANAAEAMSKGGEINIHLSDLEIGAGAAGREGELKPGNYAQVVIEDAGIGMDETTRQRIFEPFFSTKFLGRGLGLAAACGVVRNHDGLIDVASAPNKGTRVTIYLPSTGKSKSPAKADETQKAA